MLKSNPTYLNVFILIGSVLMLIFAVWKLAVTYSIFINGETTTATLTEYSEKTYNLQSSTGSDLTYAPVFTFKTNDGKLITLYSGTYSQEKKYKIGDQVRVYYPKDNPLSAKLEGYFPWKLYSVLVALGLIGVLFFGKQILE